MQIMAEIMTYAEDTDQTQGISQHIVISRDKSVYVPEIIRKSIVYRDHNVECLTFDCPRYWSGIDISELNIYVNYIAEGQKKKEEDPGSFLCENVVVDEDNTDIFHFDWKITSNASEFPDKLIFLVCAKSVDSDGNEDVHWNSHLCKDLEVQEGLEASDSIVKKYPDVIESILAKIANIESGTGGSGTVVSGVEPMEDDIPKVFFSEAIPQTKTDTFTEFRYISKTKDFSGYAEFKAQGNSSLSYPKKNMTVKMSADEALKEKLKVDFKGWGKQRKHVYKANWIDLSHARNVVSARLWADVVKSRANYLSLPELLRTSPNQGAVDGFPIKVYSQGIYQGRYTLNIPKDAWMANMDGSLDAHCILCGENYASGCFRALANINGSDWTDEIHDTVPTSIKNRWNEVIAFVMNSTDEEFKANLGNYFFVDSLIDYFIFGMVSCGLDAFGKNQLYFTYDGTKWIASIYDMDSAWGLYWNGSKFVSASYSREEFEDFVSGRQGNLLYIRLAQIFYSEIQSRYEELKQGALSIPNIINRFERFTDITPLDLVKEDYASTTGGGKFTGIPSQSTNNIQQIRQYVVDRCAYCDEYFASLGENGGEIKPTTYIITRNLTNCTSSSGIVSVQDGSSHTETITAINGYELDTISVTMNGVDISEKCVDGVLTIASVNGDITISASAIETPTVLYSLPEATTFDGTDDYIDTGLKLMEIPRNLTILVDYQADGTVNSTMTQPTLLHCMEETHPYNGLVVDAPANRYRISLRGYEFAYAGVLSIGDSNRRKMGIRISIGDTVTAHVVNSANGAINQISYTGEFPSHDSTFVIGANKSTDGTMRRYWAGTVYECKVYNYAISDEEMIAYATIS